MITTITKESRLFNVKLVTNNVKMLRCIKKSYTSSVSNPEWDQTGAVPSNALRAVSAGFKYQNLEVNSGNNGVVWIKD